MSVWCTLPIGPGQYTQEDHLGKGKPGLLCQRDMRFKPIDNKVPGPGAYTVRVATHTHTHTHTHTPCKLCMYTFSVC